MTTAYTLADLEAAQATAAELAATGADPVTLKRAQDRARTIGRLLQANGIVPLDYGLTVDEALDQFYPRAKSGDIVVWQERRYQCRFTPAEKNAAGGVVRWRRSWQRLPE